MSVDDLSLHPRVWKGRSDRAAWQTLPTGFAELDRYLPGGGWPRDALTEIVPERYGIGELSLLMPALAWLESAGDFERLPLIPAPAQIVS